MTEEVTYMIGFPPASYQRSDKRWNTIAEYLFFLCETCDGTVDVISDEDPEYYIDEYTYCLYLYNKQELIDLMNRRQYPIKLPLLRFEAPDADPQIADDKLLHLCTELRLNLEINGDEIFIYLPIDSKPQMPLKLIDKQNGCAICINCDDTQYCELPCGHSFHHDCVILWLEQNESCPTCRYVAKNEL